MEKFLTILAGLIFVFGGTHIIVNKTLPRRVPIDFEGFVIPIGVFTVLMGIALIISCVRKN